MSSSLFGVHSVCLSLPLCSCLCVCVSELIYCLACCLVLTQYYLCHLLSFFFFFLLLLLCVYACVCVCACVCMVVTVNNMICVKKISQEYHWHAVSALVPCILRKDWGSHCAFIWVLVVLQSAATSCLNTSTTWWRGPGEEPLCGHCRWCFWFCVR